jgi:vacuolar-type H+-ATPase subunit H
MDKSYIIRVYKRDEDSASGIVEDVEENKRNRFSNANQLWSLITDDTKEDDVSNVENIIMRGGK